MEAPPRPKLYLAQYGRRYPHVWRAVDALRAQRGHDIADWPPWCFLPLGWVFALVTNASNRISPEALQDSALGALAPSRCHLGRRSGRAAGADDAPARAHSPGALARLLARPEARRRRSANRALKWLSPILVNVSDAAELPTTIRPVPMPD